MRSSVDLPQPDGPTSTVNEPSAIRCRPHAGSASRRSSCDRLDGDAGHGPGGRRASIGTAPPGAIGQTSRAGGGGDLCVDDPITMQIRPSRPGRAVAPGRRAALRPPGGALVQQIEHGALRPGDRLRPEQQLALAHGVSRTVVREAVHQLKSRQLLHSRQGAGVYVAQAPAQHDST